MPDSLDNQMLHANLREARERREKIFQRLSSEASDDIFEEFMKAADDVHAAEIAYASAKGECYAIIIDVPFNWRDTEAEPVLISSGSRALLLCNCISELSLEEDDDVVDEATVTVSFTFINCKWCKIGAPKNESWVNHSLFGRGLEGYRAQVIENSPVVAEVHRLNKEAMHYNPEDWKGLRHFVFWFRDTSAEFIADSFETQLISDSLYEEYLVLSKYMYG